MNDDDDYYMKKTKKICPMCIMHTGDLPPESIKFCITHKDKLTDLGTYKSTSGINRPTPMRWIRKLFGGGKEREEK